MVAVGNGKFPGTKAQDATAQAALAQIPIWRPRNGRDGTFPFWEDALNDAMAARGMSRGTINEAPPTRPPGSTQTAEAYNLWVAAVHHYQQEGTMLFDLLRPTLDLTGPHAELDLRRLKNWKRDDRRDGRSLLRWALSFVDRSGVEGQTAILNEISAMKLASSESLLGLQNHLFGLWDLWLDLSTNKREAPAAFFSQLLMSMPTAPECPMVHVRRYLADLVRHNVSPLLINIDGDDGLFADMLKYAQTLGVSEAPAPSLHLQTDPNPGNPGGGGKSRQREGNDCCFSFACTKDARGNGGCICKSSSKFDTSTLSKTRARYVNLLRKYSKANPGKSLKVAIKLVREAVGEGDEKQEKQLTFMTSVESVVGGNINNVDELDAWLNEHEGENFYTLGMVEGEGDLQFVIEEVQPGYEAEAESLSGSLNVMAASGDSSHSVTDAELECIKLKAALAEAQNKLMMLDAPTPRAPSPPLVTTTPSSAPSMAPAPNLALDQPPTFATIGSLTPKQVWDKHLSNYLSTPYEKVKNWSVRRPQFSLGPSTPPIEEETRRTPAGGAAKETPVELVCRAVVAERRSIKEKLKQRSLTGYLPMRIIADVLLLSAGCGEAVMEAVYAHCYERRSMHTLLTLGLLINATADKVWMPLLKSVVVHVTKFMVQISTAQTRVVLDRLRAALSTLIGATMARVVTLMAARIGLAVTPQSSVVNATVAVQAAPAPSVTHVSTSVSAGGDPNPAAPVPSDGEGTLMPLFTMDGGKLGSAVMLASLELQTNGIGKPALMDNGASNGTSCTRTLDGAVPGTFRATDAGSIGIGSEGVSLLSKGSWLFVLERRGANCSEVVVRRLKFTPKLPMSMVFSEANENVVHGYSIIWNAGEKRTMVAPSGQRIQLHMSKSDLGWLQVVPITDEAKQREVLSRIGNPEKGGDANGNGWQLSVKTFNPMDLRAVNMGKTKPIKGVALVRRQHCVDGHPALPVTVKNLKLQGAFEKKLVTLEHVKLFQEQGCGACDLAKMRRRAFTVKVPPLDSTLPVVGKLWEVDVLELRVPDINTGVPYIYAAIEKVSKLALVGGMAGYSESNMLRMLNEVQARVRPTHGDIRVIRADSHPTHRAAGVKDYMLHHQLHLQLSPPYVHEGVGNVENFFLVSVPSANALLLAAPDLGENHFLQALRYITCCKNHSVTSNSNPAKSPAMVYYGTEQYLNAGLFVFGSSAMALVHGEARDSKFDEHARPCVYVGPAGNSDSPAHCAVFYDKRYLDVDCGCITVDEHVVLERTQRDHPATQPYNQVGGGKTVDVGMPTSLFDLSGFKYKEEELPRVQPIIWVRGAPMPTEYVVLLLWHGTLRAGDMASWAYELGANNVVPIPIDLKVGGQEHNLARKPIKDAILVAFGKVNALGAFLQPECSPFSAARFKQPGPPMLFNIDHVDGIPDEFGEVPEEAMIALNTVRFVAALFRASADSEKVVGLEYPASQGRSSPFSADGREKHSTIADTSVMRAVIAELGLDTVYSEQGAAGAPTRKPTAVLATPRFARALARTVGTLVSTPGEQRAIIVGTNEHGQYRSSPSEVYTPEFAMRITIALIGSLPKVMAALKTDAIGEAASASTEDLFPVGTRVELYWYGERVWYKATVIDSAVRKGKVHGNLLARREIKVKYDADNIVMWHALSDCSVRELDDDDENRDPAVDDNEAVLSLLDHRRDVTLETGAGDVDFLADLHAMDATPDYVKPVTEAVSKLFDNPAPMIYPPLMEKFTRSSVCAMAVAKLLVSTWRVGTKFKLESDETLACNAERRITELVHQLASCRDYDGPRGVQEAVDELLHEYSPAQRREMGVATADDLESEISEKALADARLAAHLGEDLPPPVSSQVNSAACQLHVLDADKGRKLYCSSCRAPVTVICMEPHCMRGLCCQPNESCARCHTPTPGDDVGAARVLDAGDFRRAMKKENVRINGMLNAHAGEVFLARQVVLDLEDQSVVRSGAAFAVLDDGSAAAVDYTQAHRWHTPQNERDYNRSPQRALWRTAKELKMDDYLRVGMFDLVPRNSVDESVHTIYRTLWAYKIKFKEGGLEFQKLNPRWCVRGGSMDRNLFKSYAEMMRTTSLNIIWGVKAAFYKQLTEAMIDLTDAFQSTSTVDENGKLLEGEREFYTDQAPGFKKYGVNGEELVCKQKCYMQGRIDSTAGFDKRFMKILTKSAHCMPLLWDPKVLVFNTTKLAGTAASLREIITEATRVVVDGEDSAPQQVPIGYALLGQHVDDLVALATGLRGFEKNRILLFIKGRSPWSMRASSPSGMATRRSDST